MRRMIALVMVVGSLMVLIRPACAGEWIEGSRKCFARFQAALKSGEADAIWDMLSPDTQKAADALAEQLRSKATTLAAADKARLEALLQRPGIDLARLTGHDLVASKAFQELHGGLLEAANPSPSRVDKAIEMKVEIKGKPEVVKMISPTGDKQNYKMILAMPMLP